LYGDWSCTSFNRRLAAVFETKRCTFSPAAPRGWPAGNWHIEQEEGFFGVFAGEALLAFVHAEDAPNRSTQKANAHLMASASLLLRACKKVSELLGSALVLTQEGFKIDATEVKGAICRAQGYRVDPRQTYAYQKGNATHAILWGEFSQSLFV
jgi:hypothetical protein